MVREAETIDMMTERSMTGRRHSGRLGMLGGHTENSVFGKTTVCYYDMI